MKKHPAKLLSACVVGLALVAASCGSDDEPAADTAAPAASEPAATEPAPVATEPAGDPGACETTDDVSLQLQWFTQAQFAGYYAAQDLGYYDNFCLNVNIVEGGFDITPQVQLANGDVDFATAWVPKALATREAGANIVNIAQVFQRSGTLQVSFADSGINSPADFKGKKIGNWGFGNEFEIFAALGQAGLDPATDVELIGQQFDMVALLEGEIDAAEAMTYNEYAQVLEAENPATGELYTPDDFTVISYEDVGVGMLQDAIWADGDKLANDAAYKDKATRFVAASMEGWAYCRDNLEACRDIVLSKGSTLGESHQLWQMNEVNKLIWPSPNGIGFIDQAAWDQTVEISQSTPNLEGSTVLTAAPDADAFTNDIVQAAWALLDGMDLDLKGEGYAPTDVVLEPGGN